LSEIFKTEGPILKSLYSIITKKNGNKRVTKALGSLMILKHY